MRYLVILTALALFSCQKAEEHGHAHDEAGGHEHADTGRPAVDATVWTDKTELFVEFPALVVGNTSRFAAHFTLLDSHEPVKEGTVTVSLIKGNKGIRQTAEAPSSPGIFTPSLQPKEAGTYQLVFDLKTPALTDRIVLNDVKVFASAEEAENASGSEEDGEAISFLKEQAWKMEFQTAPVIEKEIYEVIPTSGVWKVAPSDYRTLVATTNGTVSFREQTLTEGSRVKKGQVLMAVSSAGLTSNNLSAEIRKARAEFEQAEAEYNRKKELYESKIVPGAEFEEVKQRYEVAKANYETLSAGYSAGGKQVTVPFDGYVKSIAVGNGDFVEQGAPLLTITSHQSGLLETRVSPTYAGQLQHLHNIYYQTKADHWSNLNETGGSIVSIGKEVEPDKPLLSVFARVNDAIEMPEGNFTEVQLAVGEPVKAVVVPTAALLEDYGSYSVIVQLSGESFERRPVITGKSNGSEVEIREGLKVGEVVVTKGAYQVKMASMSGQAPAHGHAH